MTIASILFRNGTVWSQEVVAPQVPIVTKLDNYNDVPTTASHCVSYLSSWLSCLPSWSDILVAVFQSFNRRYPFRSTLFPRIHRHAVMYETEGSRHAVIASPNSLKTMLTKNGCVSYITACRKTETPNSNIFTWGPCAWVSNSKMKTFYGGQCSCFLTLFFFHKKPSKRLSPQSFLKKWLLEPSKFLNGFLIPIIFFY